AEAGEEGAVDRVRDHELQTGTGGPAQETILGVDQVAAIERLAGKSLDPGRRPGVGDTYVVPEGARHHIVAIAQREHKAAADLVIDRAADQAVGGGNGARHAARVAIAPGDGAGV